MKIDIGMVAEGLEALLGKHKGDFDAVLRQAGSLRGLKSIRGYYDENIDLDMYDLLMLQPVREGSSWYALPNISEDAYQFSIYGFIQHDDPAVAERMRLALAGELKYRLNQHHLGVRLKNGEQIEFSSPYPPISSIDYNVSNLGQPTVRGFVATWAAQAHPVVTAAYGDNL